MIAFKRTNPRRCILYGQSKLVKAVCFVSVLFSTIGCKFKRLAISSVIGVQINPLPSFAMKFIVSGVAKSARLENHLRFHGFHRQLQ